MIDLGRALKSAMTTGKVVFGVEQSEKMIKSGEAKLIIVAKNCPREYLMDKSHGVPVYQFDGTNMELGALCGKPFSVSSIAIIDKGASNILSLG